MNNKNITKYDNESIVENVFLDNKFISLFKKFVKDYNIISIASDKKEEIFLNSIIKNEINLSSFANNVISFITKSYNISIFSEYVQQSILEWKKIDNKFLNLLLKSLDYIIELNEINKEIPKTIDLIKEWTNTKIINIISRSLENLDLKLLKYNLPKTLSNFSQVQELYEKDSYIHIDLEVYYKIKDTDNNYFYINSFWYKLESSFNWFITKIIKKDLFWDHMFLNFENDKWETKLEVINIKTFEIIPFWYEKYFIWTLNSLNSDEILQYIHCKTNDLDEAEEITYTIDLEPLNLWELFNFYFSSNILNEEIKKDFEKIEVLAINEIFNFDWYSFLWLKVENYLNNFMYSKDIIINSNWKVLLHNKDINNPISHINWFKDILWMKFLSYSIWHLDWNFNTIKINNIDLIDIRKELSLWETELYLINNKFSITKNQLIEELSKLENFNDKFTISIADIYDDLELEVNMNPETNNIESIYKIIDWAKTPSSYEDALDSLNKASNKELFKERFQIWIKEYNKL